MPDEDLENQPVSYRPSVFYFRRALRRTDNPEELRELGLLLCTAYEMEREWIRSRGLIPPKQVMLEEEVEAKGWTFDEDPQQLRLL